MPMPPGKRAESKTPTVDYDAGCLARSTSTKCLTKKSRTSSSPPISRPENAWASRPLSRRSSKSLAKTCKSGSHSPVALGSRIQALQWRTDDLQRAIDARLRIGPVIVEGVLALNALEAVKRSPDFLIFAEGGSPSLR